MRALVITLSLFITLSLQGQTNKDSILASKIGQVTINAGGGVSMIYLLTQGIWGGSGFITNSTGVVGSIIADFRFTPRSSMGLAVAYQTTSGIPGEGNDNPNTQSNLTEYITRTNIALRYLYHFNNSANVDFYWGVRIGASFWTDYVSGLPNYGTLARGSSFSVLPSFQTLLGLQLFFSKVVGLHLEAAVGTPYFVEGGFTFRIKTKVKTSVSK